MENELYRYIYDGPVLAFGVCVADHWLGETMASSEKKARSNLSYQYKVKNNRSPSAQVSLPGKLRRVS